MQVISTFIRPLSEKHSINLVLLNDENALRYEKQLYSIHNESIFTPNIHKSLALIMKAWYVALLTSFGMSRRDAAGHYPTRATRPVTRPVLNRPNYPYYPWPAGIWTIFDLTRPDPWKPMKIITCWPVTIFNLDPLYPWKKLLLTRITCDIFSRNIFTKS